MFKTPAMDLHGFFTLHSNTQKLVADTMQIMVKLIEFYH